MLLALALAVLPPYGSLTSPSSGPIPVADNEALIVNSGSTNMMGYQLRVNANGWTTSQQGATVQHKRVPMPLMTRFFADLRAAAPLDAMAGERCMKSVSFGTRTTVFYRGKSSPDLSCPGAGHTLAVDAAALVDAAGLTPRSRDADR